MIACFKFYLLTDFSALDIHAKLLIFHHWRLFDWFQLFWWFDSNFTFILSLIKLCMQHGLHLYRLIVQFFPFIWWSLVTFFPFIFPEIMTLKKWKRKKKKPNHMRDEVCVCVCVKGKNSKWEEALINWKFV